MQAAAADEIHSGIHVLGCQVLFQLAGGGVVDEISRGGIVDAAGNREAGLLTGTLSLLEGGVHHITVGGEAYVAVFGLDATGKGRSSCGRIGHQAVQGIGAGDPGHGHAVEVQFSSVHHPRAAYLLESHSVANQEDYVLDLLAPGLTDIHGFVGIFLGVAVILAEVVNRVLGTVPVQGIGRALADFRIPAAHRYVGTEGP